jgi:hypothetical protein
MVMSPLIPHVELRACAERTPPKFAELAAWQAGRDDGWYGRASIPPGDDTAQAYALGFALGRSARLSNGLGKRVIDLGSWKAARDGHFQVPVDCGNKGPIYPTGRW